jgi:Uma2 family endonuclease
MAVPLRNPPAEYEAASPHADPYFYGWRPKYVRLPDGEVVEERIPLTPEDLLDPQEGDVVGQSSPHAKLANQLFDMLSRYYEGSPDVFVAFDLKMVWRIEKLPNPAPDVAIIPGVRDREAPRSTFDVVQEGTRPSLVLEVVSSKDYETRRNDYEKKVGIYEKAGVPEYIIFDPPAPETDDRLLLMGYRLGRNGYRKIQPDARGFLLSRTTNLLFGVAEDGRTVQVIDATTGERLLSSKEEEAGRKAAEEQVARLRAELERLKAGRKD